MKDPPWRISTWCRRRWMSFTPTSYAPKWQHEKHLDHWPQGDPGGSAESMGARDHAVARRPCADAHIPWERADRERGGARARRRHREPLKPHHLFAAADRAPDLA